MAKFRSGFVSNSSSSSFIIGFPEKITSEEQLAGYMGDCGVNPYGFSISSEGVVKQVWKDIKDQQPDNKVQPLNATFNADVWDDLDFYAWEFQYNNEGKNTYLDALREIERLITKTLEDRIPEDCEVTYAVSYSDEDGSYFSALEHGGIFDNIPHTRESHH